MSNTSPTIKPGSTAAYFQLLKPRVMTLVIFTGGVGLWMSGGTIEWWRALLGMLCLSFGAGAAGALNMWYERDLDAMMERTKSRPLPMGLVQPRSALIFGSVVSVLSVGLMAAFVDMLAAVILAVANLYYVFLYTIYLKPRTPQNIVIGGAAGAFPPMIGWAMATGEFSWVSFSLFLFVFTWTPPHSWALALYKRDDYAAAGFPMLPVVSGEAETKRQIILYSVAMVAVSLIPWFVPGGTSWIYGLVAVAFGIIFIAGAIRVARSAAGDYDAAKKLFGFSILYLAALFAVAAMDAETVVRFV